MPETREVLDQSLRQSAILAPQMRQSLKMLQMTSVELRAELQHQMAFNPVIEDVSSPCETCLSTAVPDEHKDGRITEHELDFTPAGTAAETVLGADDGYRDYFLKNLQCDSGDETARSHRQRLFDTQVYTETLQDHLLKQIGLSELDPADRPIAEILIGDIDEDGYFRGSLSDIACVCGVDEPRVNRILGVIRRFDPLGCGAQTLRECLLAQLECLADSPRRNTVTQLVTSHLDDIAAHRERLLCHVLGVTPEELSAALDTLRRLNPKPGRGFVTQENRALYVRPEVHVLCEHGHWRARVDSRTLPEIRISPRYLAMLSDGHCPDEAKAYVRERIRAAQTLVEAVKKRQETIRLIAQKIVDEQTPFFTKGLSALRPLTMQTVADSVGVHGTTVSRTVRDKYMTTPYGTFELRRFFTAGLATTSGDIVSNVSIRNQIKALIEKEDRTNPLSDERLADILKARGISVARRTVAKYRAALKISGAVARRIKK